MTLPHRLQFEVVGLVESCLEGNVLMLVPAVLLLVVATAHGDIGETVAKLDDEGHAVGGNLRQSLRFLLVASGAIFVFQCIGSSDSFGREARGKQRSD